MSNKSEVRRIKVDCLEILEAYNENVSVAIRDMQDEIEMYRRIPKKHGVKYE